MMRFSIGLVLVLLAAGASAQGWIPSDQNQVSSSIQEARALADQWREQRRAQAVPTELIAPFYSVAGGDESQLMVVSRVAYPVVFDLSALDAKGEILPLGRFEIKPQSHLSLLLGERIRVGGEGFVEGSVRLSFLGDDQALQSWLILHRGRQITELPLRSPTELDGRKLTAFWDGGPLGGVRPELYLVNAGDLPLEYAIEVRKDSLEQPHLERSRSIAPGQRHRVAFKALKGWLRLTHDGEPGALQVAGLLAGQTHLSALPLFSPSDVEQTLGFHSIRIPVGDTAKRYPTHLTLFNAAAEARLAEIKAVDPTSGATLSSSFEWLKPHQVTTVDLNHPAGAIHTKRPEIRAEVTADGPGLLVTGVSVHPSGEALELAFFPLQSAHSSGIYPLPPLHSHEVFTTLVNLGEEDSVVVAQFSWQGGAHAFGPVRVPAGTSYRIDVAEVAARQQPDVLGRKLDPDYRHGFLRWRVRSGSRELIARTEARPRTGRDAFGFNCNGCCEEFPGASVEPSIVDFLPGQTPSFQACITVQTCTGSEGPWPVTPFSITAPAPFSWNGANVSATGAAEEFLLFDSFEEQVAPPTCIVGPRRVVGAGKASSCKLHLTRTLTTDWEPGETCASQVGNEPPALKCNRCKTCCQAIFNYNICKKADRNIAESERNSCEGICIIDICN